MEIHNKKIIFTLIKATLFFPFLASAQAGPTVGGIFSALATQVSIVATWIVVIMWVMTGILFLMAQGDPGKLQSAKLALFSAIGGTILIILANGAILLVKNSLNI